MVNAANYGTLKICHQTKNDFQMFYDNFFLVLPDGKTVVGPDGSDNNKLIMEDITQNNPRVIATHNDHTQTVLFDSLTESLLVGDLLGHVKQYKKENGSFTLLKDYGNVNVGQVKSSAQVGRFAIFGGEDNTLVAIDVKNQKILKRSVETAYEEIHNLQICLMNHHRIFLSVSGYDSDFSSELTDLFDVSSLAMNDPTTLKNFPFKDLSEANQRFLIQQMTIESQEETIEELKKCKNENEILKRKLEEAESNYQSLKEKYESILIENESIRNKFLLLKPEIDTKNQRLIKKFFIFDKLRRQYVHKLHNPPKFTFFDQEDQSQTIVDMEKEIELLNDRNSNIFECLQKSIENEKKTKIKNQSLRIKRKEIQKELQEFQTFISEW